MWYGNQQRPNKSTTVTNILITFLWFRLLTERIWLQDKLPKERKNKSLRAGKLIRQTLVGFVFTYKEKQKICANLDRGQVLTNSPTNYVSMLLMQYPINAPRCD